CCCAECRCADRKSCVLPHGQYSSRRLERPACAYLLVMQQLEDCERGETDRALHLASIERKCRIIRSASGSMPVNRRNAPTAWNTAMPPPSSVRQPFARATRSSSVSMGK